MANTGNASSQTKRSTTAKETKDLEKVGQLPGLTPTEMIYLATANIECGRMVGVRDASVDKTQFRNNFKLMQDLYEELVTNG